MKGSALVEAMSPVGLTFYARTCGWTLARAHARSGDPVALSEYLGDDDAFDRSITDFSERYADQNDQDFQEFVKAVRPAVLKRERAYEERASAPGKTLRTGWAGGGIGVRQECWPAIIGWFAIVLVPVIDASFHGLMLGRGNGESSPPDPGLSRREG
jgi:hypothetical protein